MTGPVPAAVDLGAGCGGAATEVSVVIPAFTMQRWDLMRAAVVSAQNQTHPPSEVILSIDRNPDLFRRATDELSTTGVGHDVPVRVISSTREQPTAGLEAHARVHGSRRRFGAGYARNHAAEMATGEIIAFLDDDAVAATDWLEQLVSAYRDPEVLAAGGAPLPNYETARPRWFPADFDWVFGCAYDGLPRQREPVAHLIGANMSVRASALEAVGGFHSIDFDDMDMCHRVSHLRPGVKILYVPEAQVQHFVGAERVTWRYFWRRCFYVNKHKVAAFRDMGEAANLDAEIKFVLRSVGRGAWSAMRGLARADVYAPVRYAVTLLGIALAAAGNAAGQLEAHRRVSSGEP